MGSRGPAPKSKDKPSIAFPDGVPNAPDWLTEPAKAEYDRAAKLLREAGGALQQADYQVLANYAQASADIARLTVELRREGEVIEGPHGPIANPLLRFLAAAERKLFVTVAQLGFSPAARARVPKASATGKSANPFAAFVGGANTPS